MSKSEATVPGTFTNDHSVAHLPWQASFAVAVPPASLPPTQTIVPATFISASPRLHQDYTPLPLDAEDFHPVTTQNAQDTESFGRGEPTEGDSSLIEVSIQSSMIEVADEQSN